MSPCSAQSPRLAAVLPRRSPLFSLLLGRVPRRGITVRRASVPVLVLPAVAAASLASDSFPGKLQGFARVLVAFLLPGLLCSGSLCVVCVPRPLTFITLFRLSYSKYASSHTLFLLQVSSVSLHFFLKQMVVYFCPVDS